MTDAAGFKAFNWTGDGQIFGLFEPSHMQYSLDLPKDGKGEPTITEMTTAAITRLSRNPNGFVLMVEGGRVDHGLHAGDAQRALGDAAALDEAIAAAVAMTNPEETLIIVTADHSHTLVMQGYPQRGNPILGLVKEGDKLVLAADGKPYTTLSFANGPGSVCKKQPDDKWPVRAAGSHQCRYDCAGLQAAGADPDGVGNARRGRCRDLLRRSGFQSVLGRDGAERDLSRDGAQPGIQIALLHQEKR